MNETVNVTLSASELDRAEVLAAKILKSPGAISQYMLKKTKSGRRSVIRQHVRPPSYTNKAGYFENSLPCLETVRQFLDEILDMKDAENIQVNGTTDCRTWNVQKLNYSTGSHLLSCISYLETTIDHCHKGMLKYNMQDDIKRCTELCGVWDEFIATKKIAKIISYNKFCSSSFRAVNEHTHNGESAHTTGYAIDIQSGAMKQLQDEHLKKINQITEPSEKTMSNIKIETITFVNGKPLSDYTDDEVYCVIKKAEDKIAELNKIENKPKKLVADIDKRKSDIQKLVDYLDNK
jgi:hypothetical protein